MDGEGQYVGDEAAQWFSSYLNKPGCKMYQLSQPRVICEDEKWGDVGRPDDKVYPMMLLKIVNKQLLDEVEHDIMNYQNRGLCYLPKPKAEADNTDTRF